MKSIALVLALVMSPLAAQAGESVPYTIDGEAFEGYRANAAADSRPSGERI